MTDCLKLQIKVTDKSRADSVSALEYVCQDSVPPRKSSETIHNLWKWADETPEDMLGIFVQQEKIPSTKLSIRVKFKKCCRAWFQFDGIS